MPQIKIRGIDVANVKKISLNLITELCNITNTDRDSFTIELIESVAVSDGQIVKPYPFIEVCWFDRGQEIQDNVARSITSFVHKLGISDVDLFFTILEREKYYYNGEHF